MTWYLIDMAVTKHAISAEFSDAGYSWGVSEAKNPVSLVEIIPTNTRADAKRLVDALNTSMTYLVSSKMRESEQ